MGLPSMAPEFPSTAPFHLLLASLKFFLLPLLSIGASGSKSDPPSLWRVEPCIMWVKLD